MLNQISGLAWIERVVTYPKGNIATGASRARYQVLFALKSLMAACMPDWISSP